MINELRSLVKDDQSLESLHNVFYQSILFRKLVSYSVRIVDISLEDVAEMKKLGRSFFKASCLTSLSIIPSLWTFANVAPIHCEEMMQHLGLGLGANTIEGREQTAPVNQKVCQKNHS